MQPAAKPHSNGGSTSALWPDVAVLVLLCAVIWGNVANFKFVWDDFPFIVNNASIRSVANIPRFFTDKAMMASDPLTQNIPLFRPIRNVSFLLDYSLVGLLPAWWHVHSLLLHLINAILVLLIARSLLAGRFGALVAGGLFLLHPIQTEPVAWVKCRDDLLSTLFALALVLLWLTWRKQSIRLTLGKNLCLAALYMLACLAKEQIIVLPMLLIALEALLPRADPDQADQGGRDRGKALKRLLAFAPLPSYAILGLTGLAFLIWRTAVLNGVAQSGYPGGDGYHTLLTMPIAIVSYFRLMVFPVHQLADYSGMVTVSSWHEARFLACVSGIALILASAFALRKRLPLESSGIAWIFISLLPVLNIIPMMQFMAERFLYLPMVGLSLCCGSIVARLEKPNRGLAFFLSILLILGCGTLTIKRIPVWKDEKSLYEATAKDSEYKAIRPYYNFISALIDEGEYAKALPHARRIWQENSVSPRLSPMQKGDMARMLGLAYMYSGVPDSGLGMLRAAAEIYPGNRENILNLGLAYGNSSLFDSALAAFGRGALAFPTDHWFEYDKGIALLKLNRIPEASYAFAKCVALNPSFLPAHEALKNLQQWQTASLKHR